MKKKDFIVITNDDGMLNGTSLAIREAFSDIKGITAIAVVPSKPMSAISHAITLHKPMRAEKISENYYSLSGTPADCVRFARLFLLKKEKIRLVVSGINFGLNLGYDINYSGTCAGAREALIWGGIPGVALSMLRHSPAATALAIKFVRDFTEKLLKKLTKADYFFNINFPDRVDLKKVKITRLGDIKYKNVIVRGKDPKGMPYYWQGGRFIPRPGEKNSDVREYLAGNISITPIKVNTFDLEGKRILEEILK